MSYVNGTTHYNLPQTVGTDKRDWTDTNQAFADIDSAIHTAVETAETGATNIQALQTDVNALTTRVTSAEADIANNTTNIGLINTKVNTIDADIADVRQDAEDMICAYNEATATSSRAYAIDDYFIYNDVLYKVTAPIAIGGTIIPNTNCMATNVTTEVSRLNTNLTDVSDELTAENLKASTGSIDLAQYSSGSPYTVPALGLLRIQAVTGDTITIFMKAEDGNYGTIMKATSEVSICSLIPQGAEVYATVSGSGNARYIRFN